MKFLLLSFSILLSQLLIAQSVAINTTAATANASSILDVSSNTKGLLLPRMSKSQKNAIASPAVGLVVYQTSPDSVGFHYYNGTQWTWWQGEEDTYWAKTGNDIFNRNLDKVGIGTTLPLARLHVSKGNAGNASVIPTNRISLFEDDANNYIQLLSPNASETGILAGNASTLIKSALVFTPDSAIQLRAGGNGTDVHLDKTGRIGIGTTLPRAKLHNSWGSLANAQYFGGDFSSAIFETPVGLQNNIHLMNGANFSASIHSGTDSALSRSSINFQPDSSLIFRTGGFTQSLTIDKLGTVNANNRLIAGLATNTPPFYKFISTWGSVPSAKYMFGVNGIFEANGFSNIVQLVSSNANESVIHSGTDSTQSRSSISFQPDSSLSFRTGGFVQNLRIDKLGTVNANNRLVVGTATTTPTFYKLLSTWGSVPGAQYMVGSSGVFESNGFSNVVQLVSDNASESVIHSGTAATQSRSGISFQPDSSLSFRSGGFFERMTIEKNGFIGINNPSPKSLLHIAGTGVNAASSYYFPENNFVVEDTVLNGTAGAITNNTHLIANNNNASSIIAGSKQNPLTSSIVFRNDDRSIRFVTNASNANGVLSDVTIDSSGRVGIGFTNPSTSLGVNGAVTFVPVNPTPNVNVVTFNITVGNRTYFRIDSDNTPVNRKITLSNGLVSGQMLIIQCTPAIAGNGFRIEDADANIDINGTAFNMSTNDTITFIWDGNEWVELHRSDN